MDEYRLAGTDEEAGESGEERRCEAVDMLAAVGDFGIPEIERVSELEGVPGQIDRWTDRRGAAEDERRYSSAASVANENGRDEQRNHQRMRGPDENACADRCARERRARGRRGPVATEGAERGPDQETRRERFREQPGRIREERRAERHGDGDNESRLQRHIAADQQRDE